MVKRVLIQPTILVLAPLLAATIFCAAEGGLQAVRPDGLEIQIAPRSTANYGPWGVDQFKPVDPALATIAGQDQDPTKVVISAPGLDDGLVEVVLPTSDPNDLAQLQITYTLPVAPSHTPTVPPSDTPQPTNTAAPTDSPVPPTNALAPIATSAFTDLPAPTDTPTDVSTDTSSGSATDTATDNSSLTGTPTPDGTPASKSSSTGKRPVRKKTPPGQGNKGGNGNGNGNGGGKNK